MKTRNWARPAALAGALALAGMLSACGGDSSPTPPTPVQSPAPVRTLVGTTSFTVLGLDAANRAGFERDEALAPLQLGEAGRLEIIADWTFASNDIDINLYSGNCTFQTLTTTGCTSIAEANSGFDKPERLGFNATAGTYAIGIANYGRTNESGNFQVFLTR